MTENEAITVLKMVEAHGSLTGKAKEMAIQALEEIQQYRAIGTVEGYKRAIEVSKENYYLCAEYKAKLKEYESVGTIDEFKALKEKAEPKKAKATNYKAYCPNCNNLITDEIFLLDYAICHCKDCGQAIKGYWQ
jgi:hypothetical protein